MDGDNKDTQKNGSENEQTVEKIEIDEEIEYELTDAEKILEKDCSIELNCLEFERSMFLDMVYNDALCICAK